MRSRIIAACAAALVLGVGVAGCGGDADTDTTVATVTTDVLPPTAPTTQTVPNPPETTTSADLADRLPPEDAISGARPASEVRDLPSAAALVDALYQAGDPTKEEGRRRLEEAGYAGGALRDQSGENPTDGIALVRYYVIRLRDDAAAAAEVGDSVDEVERATTVETGAIAVTGIPGARGLRATIDQGEARGGVAFVTFSAGPYLYGIQAVSSGTTDLREDEVVSAAEALYARVRDLP